MSTEDLAVAKQRVRGLCLGKFGVHGVGASGKDNTIRIYAEDPETLLKSPCWREVENVAKPFSVSIVQEKPPYVQRRDE